MPFEFAAPKAQENELKPIYEEYCDILRKPRNFDTKESQLVEKYIAQVQAGTFVTVHQWAPNFKAPLDVKIACADRAEALRLVKIALHSLRNKVKQGYWFPLIVDGVRTKTALSQFFVQGHEKLYSPFLDCIRNPEYSEEEYRSTLGENCYAIAMQVHDHCRFTIDKMFFLKGACELVEWWQSLPDEVLESTNNNKLVLAKASYLFTCVRDYQLNGGWVPGGFINPSAPGWGNFLRWLRDTRGVTGI